jgi:putative PIN family toxin of toxin-antitoxin system
VRVKRSGRSSTKKRALRAVVDTNVLVSALLGSKNARKIVEAISRGNLIVVTSPILLSELETVLQRPKFRLVEANDSASKLLHLLKTSPGFVTPTVPVDACRDAKDNCVLEAAVAARADLIVTGDDDLLVLHPFRGIDIITPARLVERLSPRR